MPERERPEKEKRKACPIRNAARQIVNADPSPHIKYINEAYCIRESCEWYAVEYHMCAVLYLAIKA